MFTDTVCRDFVLSISTSVVNVCVLFLFHALVNLCAQRVCVRRGRLLANMMCLRGMFYLAWSILSPAAAQDHSKNAWHKKKRQQKPCSAFSDVLHEPDVTKKWLLAWAFCFETWTNPGLAFRRLEWRCLNTHTSTKQLQASGLHCLSCRSVSVSSQTRGKHISPFLPVIRPSTSLYCLT